MQRTNEVEWDIIGFVSASEYRKKIMQTLKNKPKTPKELAEETKLYFSHVSTTLKDLSGKKLVKCLNPSIRKGKIYSLTKRGEKIIKYLR